MRHKLAVPTSPKSPYFFHHYLLKGRAYIDGRGSRLRLESDGTRAENRFSLSAKRTSPLNRRGHQFRRLLAAEVCASAVVKLDTPRSEVV